jgi:ABC-2 type transport system ATP-binding protein
MPEILRVERLSKSYGKKSVLDDVSFSLKKGEMVGIAGPSGCGKSTLVKVILGLEGKNGGKISLRGSASYVPQRDSFYPFLTVRENLEYFAALRKGRIPNNLFGLSPDQRGSELSGGQRKRLSIACSLTDAPDLLLLDEPTVGLDPVSKKEVIEFLKELRKKGTTPVIITHLMNEAEECDRVLFLAKGGVRAFGNPAALRRRYKAGNLEEVFVKIVR